MCVKLNCAHCGFLFVIVLLANFHDSLSQNDTALKNNAPIEFPRNESQYPFVHNTTILKVLTSQTSNDTGGEVDDLLHGGLFSNNSKRGAAEPELQLVQDQSIDVVDKNPDAELIEDEQNSKKTRQAHKHQSDKTFVQDQLVAVLACLLVLIVFFGYGGLLVWKRFLEHKVKSRHGNREILVNEEDFYDPNDMRHFSNVVHRGKITHYGFM